MSYTDTELITGILNDKLAAYRRADNPYLMRINGKPRLHIVSFEPLAYETYGTLRNRAPRIVGTLALRSLLTWSPPEGGTAVLGAVQAESEGYGFRIGLTALNNIATDCGYPDIRFELNAEVDG